jgi:hypothetical protein
VIALHIDHAPQVKALVDELYLKLAENGINEYQSAIEAEYGSAGQRIEHCALGQGFLSVITSAARGDRPSCVTHLIYGHCTTAHIRENLIARGLGSLPITRVYPWRTVLVADDSTDED